MNPADAGRLPLWRAAFVVARRDFTAILFSRAFIFFLLGPLFPVVVMALAGGVGAQVQNEAPVADIGIAMEGEQVDAMIASRNELSNQLRGGVPPMVEIARLQPGEAYDARAVLENAEGSLAALEALLVLGANHAAKVQTRLWGLGGQFLK